MTDASEYQRAARALRRLPAIADEPIADAERRIGREVEDNVRAAARRYRRTGRLERGITTDVKGSGADTVVTVRAGAPHAHLLAGGTRPHTIAAVRAHALPLRRGGSVAGFAERVRHPGTRPRPFFAEGVEASDGAIERVLADTADTILDELTTTMRRR